jgi:predicted enzyme related to lactoylglutathione lyase
VPVSMRIASIWLPVERWQAAKRFYGELLGLEMTASDDGMGRATFATGGGPAIVLARMPERSAQEGGAMVRFECDSVDTLKLRLSEAGMRVEPHILESRTSRVLRFYDPDGNCLEAIERVV